MEKNKCFVVCEHLSIKIVYDNFFEEAVSLFCDGFSPYEGRVIDCTIFLHMNDTVTDGTDKLIRQMKNDTFVCYLCKSKAELIKKVKQANIYFSLHDLTGSSGNPNYNIVYFFLTEIITRLLVDQGYCAYHASSISKNGKAVVIMGESMSGKTTMSLQLARKGYGYLGDDRLFIKNGQVFAYPKPLHIAHDTRHLFEADCSSTRKKTGKSYVRFKDYIDEKSLVFSAKIACVFLMDKEKIGLHKTQIKNMRGKLYGLNSLFYCEEEFPALLDSILAIDDIPVYIFTNGFDEYQIETIHQMLSNVLLV